MRILIHDFAGHPFQIQLSRELARRGYRVTHAYAEGLPGPKGKLKPANADPSRLRICGIQLTSHFRKYSPVRRLLAQRTYARDLCALIRDEKPDVVLSGNTPIDVQSGVLSFCLRQNIGFVHWVQDVYYRALEFLLRPKLGPLAQVVTFPFRQLEKRVVLGSDSVIVITPGFRSLLSDWGRADEDIVVAENWAPLDEVKLLPRTNAWSREQGFGGEPIFLYSGTLGIKHRPDLLYELAKSLRGQARVVVLSEGLGRHRLERMPTLENLMLLGFQPYERLSEVLASADVLIATLESDAGQFAVPSKILTYLCAGRPVLLAAPRENLAASVIERSGGGVVTDPDDLGAWVAAANKLALDQPYREELGVHARRYAESAFDIRAIAGVFEKVLNKACHNDTYRARVA
jgi:glycosyltransferase involved in cell wall biosynthesis